MNLERQKLLHELLDRALDLSAEDREALFEESCRDDPELRREVENLLASEADLGELRLATHQLDSALAGHGEASRPSPATIGPYEVLELLGEGGMGRVFLAEQRHPVRRRVALKILRFAAFGDGSARFEAERHAMGRLDHPNVGKILEAGTTSDGLPFFAMELIEGLPLTDYCDRQALTLERRLRLFVDVCRGVDHAHRKLLLHRDLKPSNILVSEVDGQPVPKIIDFGIAKGLDRSLGSDGLMTGDRILGTPAYMSPEAASGGGELDVRSDVYSLGVVLYELLTGSRPFSERDTTPLVALEYSSDEVVERPSTRVTKLDPESRELESKRRSLEPREFSRFLRGDLDWISLKALAFAPSERYGSVTELAADVERHLDDEPVSAHRPTAGYLLRKLVRRHRGRVIAAALVTVSLILGTLGTTVGFFRARAEADRANREADTARRAQQTSDQLAAYLENLFGEADSSLENPADLTAREILERGAAGLETELRDRPRTRAALLRTVGDIFTRWDDLTTAQELLGEALELLEQLDPASELDLAADRADVLEKLADLRYKETRFGEAFDLVEEALSLQAEVDGDGVQEARLHHRAAASLVMANRLDEAEQRLRTTLELLEQLPATTPGRLDVQGYAHMTLGALAQRRRDPQGLDYYRQAVSLFEVAHGRNSRRLVPALHRLSYWLVNNDRLDEAETVIRRCLDLQQRLLGPETLPVARSLHLLGQVYNKQGDLAAAERSFRRSVEIRRRLVSGSHTLGANTVALLAYVIWLQDDGRLREVRTLFGEAEEGLAGHETTYPVYSAVMELRGHVELGENRPAVAETYYRRAVEYLRGLEDAPPSHLSRDLMRVAKTLLAQDRDDEAHELCRESLWVVEQSGHAARIASREQELDELGCLS